METTFDLEFMITGLAAIATFVSIVALALPFVQKDGLSSRLKAVAARREELSRMQKAKFQRGARFQPKRHVNMMRSILGQLNMQDIIASKSLRQRMAQAGWRGQQAAVVFGFARLTLPLVFGIFTLILVTTSSKMTAGFPVKMMIVLGAMIIGYYLPMVLLSNAISTRQALVQKAFPDALDLLSICVEAGLSVEAAFARVSEEIGEQSPVLAEEFGLTTAELAFLGDRRLAYDGLAERTGLPATKSLATALVQSEKYGTPMTVSLRVLSQESRDYRMSMAERKAGSLPAMLTVPMIGCFLPALFVVILGPAIITIMAMK